MRKWDQSERYIIALNFDHTDVTLHLTQQGLPAKATVVISTNADLAHDTSVNLAELRLGPQQAVMLKFPYTP